MFFSCSCMRATLLPITIFVWVFYYLDKIFNFVYSNHMEKSKKIIRVCVGGSCRNEHAEKIMNIIEGHYNLKAGEKTSEVDLDFIGCLGDCDFAVSVEINGVIINKIDADNVITKIEEEYQNQISSSKKNTADQIFEENYLGDL